MEAALRCPRRVIAKRPRPCRAGLDWIALDPPVDVQCPHADVIAHGPEQQAVLSRLEVNKVAPVIPARDQHAAWLNLVENDLVGGGSAGRWWGVGGRYEGVSAGRGSRAVVLEACGGGGGGGGGCGGLCGCDVVMM